MSRHVPLMCVLAVPKFCILANHGQLTWPIQKKNGPQRFVSVAQVFTSFTSLSWSADSNASVLISCCQNDVFSIHLLYFCCLEWTFQVVDPTDHVFAAQILPIQAAPWASWPPATYLAPNSAASRQSVRPDSAIVNEQGGWKLDGDGTPSPWSLNKGNLKMGGL